MATWWEENAGGLLGGALGAAGVYSAYGDLQDIGDKAQTQAGALADQLQSQAQFKPYGITTGTGGQFGMTQDPLTGQMQYKQSLGDKEWQSWNALQNNALSAFGNQSPAGYGGMMDASQQAFTQGSDFMNRAGQDTAMREADIYNRMRAMQSPEEERQRMMLEERQFNQGRQGVSTAMYGGTPEQLAMNKAQAEAQNMAAYQAMQQAQAEQAQQAQIGSAFTGMGGTLANQGSGLLNQNQQRGLSALQGSYIPQASMNDSLQPGMTAAAAQQQQNQYGLGLWGETQMSGLDAYLGANLGGANLLGNAASGMLAGATQSLGGGGGDSALAALKEMLGL